MKPKALLPGFTFSLLCLALSAAPVTANAQCDAGADAGPDPALDGVIQDVFPAADAFNVPTDTTVRLRYLGRPPMPPTLCVRVRAGGTCLPGSAAVFGHEVVWSSQSNQLDTFTEYTVTYADIAGGSVPFTFRTGSGPSAGPPSFNGIDSAVSQPSAGDSCDPGAVDITVAFTRANPPASVDGVAWPDSDIEYVIYQTRGPNISGPRIRDRVRLQRSGSTADRSAQRTFRLSSLDASGPVCFSVEAFDPLGRNTPTSQEACTNPAQGNYFQACTARPGSTSPRHSLFFSAILTGLAAFFYLSRRRRLAPDRTPL